MRCCNNISTIILIRSKLLILQLGNTSILYYSLTIKTKYINIDPDKKALLYILADFEF